MTPDEQTKLDYGLINVSWNVKTGMVQKLLAEGANVHAWNDLALRLAATHGHAETVKVLLAAGADVHASDDYALRWAANNGHAETAQVLLAAGADVHAKHDDALVFAASHGHTKTVKVLLAANANMHADDDAALRWAAGNDHTETVKVLLAAGADVHADDDAALRLAANNGHTQTVLVLVKHIFAPDSWRAKSRVEIEAQAEALYEKTKAENLKPEYLREAASILLDHALTCWEQVRPPPPKLTLSPLPAQPRPL
jgi:ankyrin repeat protein